MLKGRTKRVHPAKLHRCYLVVAQGVRNKARAGRDSRFGGKKSANRPRRSDILAKLLQIALRISPERFSTPEACEARKLQREDAMAKLDSEVRFEMGGSIQHERVKEDVMQVRKTSGI